jgi:hypothetical protein
MKEIIFLGYLILLAVNPNPRRLYVDYSGYFPPEGIVATTEMADIVSRILFVDDSREADVSVKPVNKTTWNVKIRYLENSDLLSIKINKMNGGITVIKHPKNLSVNTKIVDTPEKAVKLALLYWDNIYGQRVYTYPEYNVSIIDDDWVLYGELKGWVAGGAPYAEINSDTGRVIKMAHDK